MTWDQILVSTFGVVSIYMSQTKGLERFACFPGLLSQPGWLWSAWSAGQFGNLFVCCVIALIWIKGFYRYWIKHETT